jgi:hypothetical protein
MNRSLHFAAAILATVPGCQRVLYRAETILHADGSVDRAIYQPLEATPKDDRDPKRWQRVTFSPPPERLDKEGWPASLRLFTDQAYSNTYPYLVAYREFRSPDQISNYLILRNPDTDVPPAHLVRRYYHADLVFVDEYLWSETLTDDLTLARMRKARDELADLCIDLGRDTFNEALGRDYDCSALVHWCRTEGKEWLAESTDFVFLHAAVHKGKHVFEDDEVLDQLGAIGTRHGLRLKPNGKFLSDMAGDQAVHAYATALILRHVRRRDGQSIAEDTARAWVNAVLGPQQASKPGLFQAAEERVVARDYGGRQALDRRASTLLFRAFGYFFLTFGNIGFEHALTVPGQIVETNGEIVSDQRVRWRFPLHQAFPLGYTMSCRSLLPRTRAQTLLLGKALLVNRDELLQFLELVADQKPLLEALQESSRHTTLVPLYSYVKKLSAGSREAEQARRLMRMLKLP